jgi:hypothetical protein
LSGETQATLGPRSLAEGEWPLDEGGTPPYGRRSRSIEREGLRRGSSGLAAGERTYGRRSRSIDRGGESVRPRLVRVTVIRSLCTAVYGLRSRSMVDTGEQSEDEFSFEGSILLRRKALNEALSWRE